MVHDEAEDRPKRQMNWLQYGDLEGLLVEKILKAMDQEKGQKIDVVIGVFRGGLVMARSMASKLGDVPVIIIKQSKNGDGEIKFFGDDEELDVDHVIEKNMNALLVDDISDSGETFKTLIKYLETRGFKTIFTAALVLKEYSGHKPNFHALLDKSDDYIVFPWE